MPQRGHSTHRDREEEGMKEVEGEGDVDVDGETGSRCTDIASVYFNYFSQIILPRLRQDVHALTSSLCTPPLPPLSGCPPGATYSQTDGAHRLTGDPHRGCATIDKHGDGFGFHPNNENFKSSDHSDFSSPNTKVFRVENCSILLSVLATTNRMVVLGDQSQLTLTAIAAKSALFSVHSRSTQGTQSECGVNTRSSFSSMQNRTAVSTPHARNTSVGTSVSSTVGTSRAANSVLSQY